MSLDQIGPLGNKIEDVALVLDVIRGEDTRDTTTYDSKPIELQEVGKIKVGVLLIGGIDDRINSVVERKLVEVAKKNGWALKNIEVKHVELAVETYYPLVYSEFFSATRRFDGRRYGYKIEDSCGEEVLRRILGGSEITKAEFAGAYYRKALEVKELIKEEFERVFKDVDCVILPTVPGLPWKIGEKMKVEEVYAYDALTIPANLAEICAVSMPAGELNGIPVGLQVMCAKGEDAKMLSIAKCFE
jgi:aspartyl-tRNA(Asn)/glutamyl-tRNA(Gln) amidotransferase subunit A